MRNACLIFLQSRARVKDGAGYSFWLVHEVSGKPISLKGGVCQLSLQAAPYMFENVIETQKLQENIFSTNLFIVNRDKKIFKICVYVYIYICILFLQTLFSIRYLYQIWSFLARASAHAVTSASLVLWGDEQSPRESNGHWM